MGVCEQVDTISKFGKPELSRLPSGQLQVRPLLEVIFQ